MVLRRIIGGSVLLLGASAAAGFLNYVFQLRGAARLGVEDYGRLNVWMAYFSLAGVLGSVVQIAANFFVLDVHRLRRLAILVGVGTTLGAAAAAAGYRAGMLPLWAMTVVTVAIGIAPAHLVGQFQVRTLFVPMGTAAVVGAVAKLGTTFAGSGPAAQVDFFYLGFPVAAAAAAAWLAICTRFLPAEADVIPAAGRTTTARGIASSLLLAFAMSLVPQIDLLSMRLLQADDVVGHFSRASLFARAVFFGGVTTLQVTLPFHARAGTDRHDRGDTRLVHLLEWGVLGGCVAGSFVVAGIAPFVARRWLGFDLGPYRMWVLLSCVSMSLLLGLLQQTQIDCARGKLRPAVIRLLCLVLVPPAAALLGPADVPSYLLGASCAYGLLYLLDRPLQWLGCAWCRDAPGGSHAGRGAPETTGVDIGPCAASRRKRLERLGS